MIFVGDFIEAAVPFIGRHAAIEFAVLVASGIAGSTVHVCCVPAHVVEAAQHGGAACFSTHTGGRPPATIRPAMRWLHTCYLEPLLVLRRVATAGARPLSDAAARNCVVYPRAGACVAHGGCRSSAYLPAPLSLGVVGSCTEDGTSISNSYIAPLFVKMNCKQNLDLRCVLISDPSTTLGAGAKTRLHTPNAVTYHEQPQYSRCMIGHSLSYRALSYHHSTVGA